jgi:hypothetical protein
LSTIPIIEDLHKYNGSGSITYRRILQKTQNYTIEKCNPAKKMEKDYYYYEKAFNLWKLNFLPTNIAMHQLKTQHLTVKVNIGQK